MDYGMSEIENLEFIKCHGIDKFLKKEQNKYVTKDRVFCVHDRKYY